jgi:DNA polymerase III delta subunit
MLYVFYGTDTNEVRQQAFLLIHQEEADGARVRRISADEYMPGLFLDVLGAVSLFGEREIYLLDTPSQNSDMYQEVIASLSAFAESHNTFIIIESALVADERKKFAKHTEKIVECKSVAKERYTPFALTDALLVKDKKKVWILLQEARRVGLSSEEIIGTLWWQLKSLRITKHTKSAEEAGMKEYPYKKAKQALANFKPGEVEHLSRTLLTVYHDGHSGLVDIDQALEKWVLSI